MEKNLQQTETSTMEFNAEKRTDLLRIDPRSIYVRPNFNPRSDFAEAVSNLKPKIEAKGVIRPLYVSREKGTNPETGQPYEFVLIDGECRLRATMELIGEGCDIKYVPAQLAPKGMTEEEKAMFSLLLNDHNPLKPIEKGEKYRQFVEGWGWTMTNLAKELGTTVANISQCIAALSLPMAVKEAIKADEISMTAVAHLQEQTKNSENPEQALRDVVAEKIATNTKVDKKTGKKKTITAKDVVAEIKAYNLWKAMRVVYDNLPDDVDFDDNRFTVFSDLIELAAKPKTTMQDLIDFFVEKK